MTHDSLLLLRDMLARQQLTVGQDDFLLLAAAAATALAELDAELTTEPGEHT